MVFILNTEFGLFTYKMIFIENRQWAPISRDCRLSVYTFQRNIYNRGGL